MTRPSMIESLEAATAAGPLVRVDEATVTGYLDALGIADPNARIRAREVLQVLLEDAAEAPLEVRLGRWELTLPRHRLPGLVASALITGALTTAGVDNVPLVVLGALVPVLFRVENATVRADDTVAADLRKPLTTPADRTAWWQLLPEDLRHEVSTQDVDMLVERLERAGSLRRGAVTQSLRWSPSHDGHEPPLILAVADEWFPAHGGVSALNHSLCAALAAEHARVFCLVPAFSPDEWEDAREARVELLRATPVPGLVPRTTLMRRPALPDGCVPDIIIGHSRLTGQEAKALAEDHFPAAKRLHLIHMSPDEIEWFKSGREDDAGQRAETRTALELELARGAALMVAVGPRLHARFERDAHAVPGLPPVHRLDPGFADDERLRNPTPGSPLQILVTGRLEDAHLKGLDIGAQAVGRAVKLLGSPDLVVEILVRGAPVGASAALREAVHGWAATPAVSATPRPFTTDAELLAADRRRAVLLLMPSRAEGFGLTGLEAIDSGTPALISANSGLGMLLRELLPAHLADRVVLPVNGDAVDAEVWGAAVFAVLRDLPGAYATAADVRAVMARQRTWSGAAKALLQAVRS